MNHAITALLLLAAAGFYALGMALSGTILVAVGCVLELAFWIRVLRASDVE